MFISTTMAHFSLYSVMYIFVAVICHTGKATVYMDSYCGSTISLAGDRLKSQAGSHYDTYMDCTIGLEAPTNVSYYGISIVLDFEWLNMECGSSEYCSNFLEVYDGPNTNSPLLLRDWGPSIPPSVYSTGHSLTLRMKTGGSIGLDSDGFSLIFTALYPGQCINGTKFSCNSGRCIDSSLTCDCKNNCGDNSDEDSCPSCKPDVIYGGSIRGHTFTVSKSAIIGIAVGFVVVTGLVITIVRMACNKKKQNQNNTVRTNQVMTSSHPTGPLPPPPPMPHTQYPPSAPGPGPYVTAPNFPPNYCVSVGTDPPGYYPPPSQQTSFPTKLEP